MNRLYISLVVVCLAGLVACQPSYVADQSKLYARKIGVSKQFDIIRGNSRVLAVSSRLSVVAEPNDSIDVKALSTVVAGQLAPYFQQLSVAQPVQSIEVAAVTARKNGSDYAVYLRVVDSRELIRDDNPSQSSDYHRLRLLMTIIDANSLRVIDKIQLLAKSSHFSLTGNNMQSLLSEPLRQISQDLSGKSKR